MTLLAVAVASEIGPGFSPDIQPRPINRGFSPWGMPLCRPAPPLLLTPTPRAGRSRSHRWSRIPHRLHPRDRQRKRRVLHALGNARLMTDLKELAPGASSLGMGSSSSIAALLLFVIPEGNLRLRPLRLSAPPTTSVILRDAQNLRSCPSCPYRTARPTPILRPRSHPPKTAAPAPSGSPSSHWSDRPSAKSNPDTARSPHPVPGPDETCCTAPAYFPPSLASTGAD
jgi:hypothetical protein